MILLSKKKLDRIIERDNTDRMISRLVNVFSKAVIPLLVIEGVIALLLSGKINIFISMLAFVLLDVALPFLICFSAIFIDAALKIIRSTGGVISAIRSFGSIRRTKRYYNLFMDELCSDNTLAEALSLEKASGGKGYAYLSALSHVMECHGMRCEFDEAKSAFDKLIELPQKDFMSRNDFIVNALDYAVYTDNHKLYLDTISEYEDVLVRLEDRDTTSVCVLLTIAANEHKLHGDFRTALQYLEWYQEYRAKMIQQGKNTNQRPVRNFRRYSDATVCLDKAEIYLLLKDPENARTELVAADEAISALTCDIPPVFIKEREKLISLLREEKI